MKTNVFFIILMAACMALNAHTATDAFYKGNTDDMWFAIGTGVGCAFCFGTNLYNLIRMAKKNNHNHLDY